MTRLALITLLCAPLFCVAQEPVFEWATAMQSDEIFDSGAGHDCGMDALENVFSIGSFSNRVDFDPSSSSMTLTSVGFNDLYVMKQDNTGALIWVKTIGTPNGSVAPYSLDMDSQGNLILTGTFKYNTDFDPGPGTYYLNGTGFYNDGFVLKLDPDGNFIWARMLDGSQTVNCNSVSVDNADNVVITGFFDNTVNFDPGGTNDSQTSGGYNDGFVLKLKSDGSYLWAKTLKGVDNVRSFEAVTSDDNEIYVAGAFYLSADFDPGPSAFNLVAGINTYDYDGFVLKLDPNGGLIWAKQLGGGNLSGAGISSLTLDASENIILIGEFGGTVDFDPGAAVYNLTTQNQGINNGVVVGLNTNGEFLFARQLESNYIVELEQIKCNSDDELYISGQFMGDIDFNPDALAQELYSSTGYRDAFLLKLSATGDFMWVKTIEGSDEDCSYGLSVNPQGTLVYATGSIRRPALFIPQDGVFELPSLGNPLAYVLKLYTTDSGNGGDDDPGSENDPVSQAASGTMILPNIITPNGDLANDLFIPLYLDKDVTVDHILICNRWGNPVFQSSSFDSPWNGECSGNPCAEGTYFWQVNYHTLTGEKCSKHGNVTVQR